MKTKTAMQELLIKINDKLSTFNSFNPEDRFTQGSITHLSSIKHMIERVYLFKEKQQIIEARLSVTGLNHASPTDDNSLQDAENYFTQKYEQ